jgi:hypothetical protein
MACLRGPLSLTPNFSWVLLWLRGPNRFNGFPPLQSACRPIPLRPGSNEAGLAAPQKTLVDPSKSESPFVKLRGIRVSKTQCLSASVVHSDRTHLSKPSPWATAQLSTRVNACPSIRVKRPHLPFSRASRIGGELPDKLELSNPRSELRIRTRGEALHEFICATYLFTAMLYTVWIAELSPFCITASPRDWSPAVGMLYLDYLLLLFFRATKLCDPLLNTSGSVWLYCILGTALYAGFGAVLGYGIDRVRNRKRVST